MEKEMYKLFWRIDPKKMQIIFKNFKTKKEMLEFIKLKRLDSKRLEQMNQATNTWFCPRKK